MRRFSLILVAVLLVGCGGTAPVTPSPSPIPSHIITGSLKLFGVGHISLRGYPPAICEGTGGYDDVRAGASIVVLNESGTTIGTVALPPGAMAQRDTWACWFDFTLPGIPDAPFYSVKVNQRAGPTWSRAQMEANGWKVELALGE